MIKNTVLQHMISKNNVCLATGQYKHMMKDYFSAVYDKHTAMFQTVIIRQTFSIFGIYMVVFLQTFSRICLSTVEPRYLELAYFELPLISK